MDETLTLKQLRVRKDLTQAELGRLTGLNQGHVSALELGRMRNPNLVTLNKLAGVYGVPLDTIAQAFAATWAQMDRLVA